MTIQMQERGFEEQAAGGMVGGFLRAAWLAACRAQPPWGPPASHPHSTTCLPAVTYSKFLFKLTCVFYLDIL